jgi:predicted NBD/HSP70 family sugar kinase
MASNKAAVRYYLESKEHGSTPSILDLIALAEQGDVQAVKALNTMADYLGRGLCMLATGLSPSVIVVVGEITRAWSRFEPVLLKEVAAYPLPGGVPCIIPAHDGETARLRGTVALVLQKHFAASSYL